MPIPLRVLILNTQPSDADMMMQLLREADFEPQWRRVETEEDYRNALEYRLDMILVDDQLPQMDALQALQLLHRGGYDIPFIVLVSEEVDRDVVAQCMNRGAADCVFKDRLWRLGDAVTRIWAYQQLREEHRKLQRLEASERGYPEDIEEAGQALRRANQTLTARIQEMTLLNEMSEILRTCLLFDEVYDVVKQFSPRLFPNDAGALYMLNSEYNIVETGVVWGPPSPDSQEFTPDQCWALRRGQVHLMIGQHSKLYCHHIPEPYPGQALCVPMMAHGDTVGVYYVCRMHEEGDVSDEGDTNLESWKRMAVAVAEQIGLSLGNLKLIDSLSHQAVRDPLTGLFNRRYMEESLEREVRRAKREKHPLGVIMLDLDYLKEYNDRYGHEAGNVLLSTLGDFLEAHIRGEDIACRYGGDEFTLILPGISMEVIRQRAEFLLDNVKTLPVYHHGQSLGTVTVTLGVAIYPDDGASGEEVLHAADRALYYAKSSGKNQLGIWQDIPHKDTDDVSA